MRKSNAAGARHSVRSRAIRHLAKAASGAAALATLTAAAPALAYCRTSVCLGETGAVCEPARPQSDCGIPLFWPSPCVSYSIQEDASANVSLAETESIFAAAFATWMHADCGAGGQTPRLFVEYTGPVECGKHEYNQNQHNANVIVFREDAWPYPERGNTLALTTVTYNLDSGEIYDADMELNSFNQQFSLDDNTVTFDLLSIATHEAGHFLGLSHSYDSTATMYFDYKPGSVSLRDLTDDDTAAICAVYPPGEPIKDCDPTPRHGFSSLCAANQPDDEEVSGCSTAAAGGGRDQGFVLALIALLGAALRRTRRSVAAATVDGAEAS